MARGYGGFVSFLGLDAQWLFLVGMIAGGLLTGSFLGLTLVPLQ